MKPVRILIAAIGIAAAPLSANAQDADPAVLAAQQTAMHVFDGMHGEWRGDASYRGPGGEHHIT